MLDQIAVVYWLDAASHDVGWDDLDLQKEVTGLVSIVSVGLLISDNEKEIRITRSCHENEGVIEGMFVIPKGMVQRIELIPVKKKRKPKKNGSTAVSTPKPPTHCGNG